MRIIATVKGMRKTRAYHNRVDKRHTLAGLGKKQALVLASLKVAGRLVDSSTFQGTLSMSHFLGGNAVGDASRAGLITSGITNKRDESANPA